MFPTTSSNPVPLPLKVKFPLLALKCGSAPGPPKNKSPGRILSVPVITKLGQSLTARVCGSLLTAFNLSEMITKNNHDYKNLAYQLAKDNILLKKIKTKVSQNKFSSKLFNTKEYVMNLERGFKLAHDLKINKNLCIKVLVEVLSHS